MAKNLKLLGDEERLSLPSESPLSLSAKQINQKSTAGFGTNSTAKKEPYYLKSKKQELIDNKNRKILNNSSAAEAAAATSDAQSSNWTNLNKINLKYKEEKDLSKILGTEPPVKMSNERFKNYSPNGRRL